MTTLFAIVAKDGTDSICMIEVYGKVQNTEHINTWIEAALLARGYEDVLLLHKIDRKFFELDECIHIVLEY